MIGATSHYAQNPSMIDIACFRHLSAWAIDAGSRPVKQCQAKFIRCVHQDRKDLFHAGEHHAQHRGSMTEVIPERTVAPNAVVDIFLWQRADAWVSPRLTVVQGSKHLRNFTHSVDEIVQ